MSKRGRRWIGKLKKKVKSDKLSKMKYAFSVKKKATKEQWNKIKLGVYSLQDIEEKGKEFKEHYEKTGDAESKDKYERIEEIVKLLKHMKINEAKKLGQEFDNLYPNQF